jgi:HD-GYP domain-containing protein (c-di-GMP phosphodiesterase class II)
MPQLPYAQKSSSGAESVRARRLGASPLDDDLDRDPLDNYVPLDPGFLVADTAVPFDVFQMDARDRPLPLMRAGEKAPIRLVGAILRGENPRPCLARADQMANVLEHQKKTLEIILNNTRLPIGLRCRALHAHSLDILRGVFAAPAGSVLHNAVEHLARLVRFVFREGPIALKSLLRTGVADYSDASHALNVGMHSLEIALEYFGRQSRRDFNDMAAGFFLHDIGKTRVREGILDKPGPLLEAEWWEVKKHPRYGFILMEREGLLSEEARLVALQHHERMDGEGYPDLLLPKDIHPYARICAVADAFDALTSRRVFRSSREPFHALRAMKEEMRAQFDPDIFRIFVILLKG